jgi:hypothetical protein
VHPQLWALGQRLRFKSKRQPVRSQTGIWIPGMQSAPRRRRPQRTDIPNLVSRLFLMNRQDRPPRSRLTAKDGKWHFPTNRWGDRFPPAKQSSIHTKFTILFRMKQGITNRPRIM